MDLVTGIIDEGGEWSVFFLDRRDQRRRGIVVGYVVYPIGSRRAEVGGGLLEYFLAAAGKDDLGALGDEGLGDSEPEAGATAGDQAELALEAERVWLILTHIYGSVVDDDLDGLGLQGRVEAGE